MNSNQIIAASFHDELTKIAQGYPTYQDYQPEPQQQGGGFAKPAIIAAGAGAGAYGVHKWMQRANNAPPSMWSKIRGFSKSPLGLAAALGAGFVGTGIAKGVARMAPFRGYAKGILGENADDILSGGFEMPMAVKKMARRRFGLIGKEGWEKRDSASKAWRIREDNVKAGKELNREQRHALRKQQQQERYQSAGGQSDPKAPPTNTPFVHQVQGAPRQGSAQVVSPFAPAPTHAPRRNQSMSRTFRNDFSAYGD